MVSRYELRITVDGAPRTNPRVRAAATRRGNPKVKEESTASHEEVGTNYELRVTNVVVRQEEEGKARKRRNASGAEIGTSRSSLPTCNRPKNNPAQKPNRPHHANAFRLLYVQHIKC